MSTSTLLATRVVALGGATSAAAQFCEETFVPASFGIDVEFATAIDAEREFVVLAPRSGQGTPCEVYTTLFGPWSPSGFIPSDGTTVEATDVALSEYDLFVGTFPLCVVGQAGEPNGTLAGSSGLVTVHEALAGGFTIATLVPPSTLGYPIEGFGASIEVIGEGDWILVGAPATFGDAGCVFSYERTGPSTWTFRHDVFAGTAPDRFGTSIAAEGYRLIVGAPGSDTSAGPDAGAVYFYDLDPLTGEFLFVGSDGGGSAGAELGGAFVAFGGDPFTTTDLGSGLAGVAGLTPQLTATSSFCEGDDFTLTFDDVLPFAQAGLFIGFQPSINAPFKGGTLVPSPDLLLILSTGLGTVPITSPWPIGVNIPLEFPYWIQDPAGPAGFSASNAIRVAP